MIHVSNRPKGEKVPNKKDFPSLPSSSKQAQPAYLNNIAAKHRNLVDDYVSAASGAFQKINLVQKEEVKTEPKVTAPSLTKQDFPTLAKVAKSSPDFPAVKTPNGKNKTTNTSSWANTTQLRKSLSKTNAKYGLDNNNKKDVVNKMNGNAKPKETKKEKPRVNGPTPPGFDGPKPPPGFSSVSLNSIAKTANNLTFTSSLGDKFRIIPSYQFTPPENCGKRNQDLVKIFKSSMPTVEAMEEFRNNTQRFRNGAYPAGAYYEHCEFVLEDKFHVVFPELLALLPDIGKQQELYLVYSQRLKHLQKKGITNKLKVCSVCKQVLLTTDHLVHMAIHENNNKAEEE
ncbi:ZNF598.2 family protein [Megaselia abdita]